MKFHQSWFAINAHCKDLNNFNSDNVYNSNKIFIFIYFLLYYFVNIECKSIYTNICLFILYMNVVKSFVRNKNARQEASF